MPQDALPHYIFDLDGTLADTAHRIHHISGPNKDWDAFYEACDQDEPIPQTIAIAQCLHQQGFRITILTGRSEVVTEKTRDWLHRFDVPFYMLVMRPEGNFTPDHILKAKTAEELGLSPSNVWGVFEDRARVANMWRQKGYICYQVDEGNF